jgi:hypothetical protein
MLRDCQCKNKKSYQGRTYPGWMLAVAIPANRAAKMIVNFMFAGGRGQAIADRCLMRERRHLSFGCV